MKHSFLLYVKENIFSLNYLHKSLTSAIKIYFASVTIVLKAYSQIYLTLKCNCFDKTLNL